MECLVIETVVSICTEIGQQEMEKAIVEFSIGKFRCAGEVKLIKEELAVCRAKIEELCTKITEQQQQPCALPYCEKSLVDDSQVYFFTGLLNMHILKSVLTMFITQWQWNGLTVISFPHSNNLCMSC